jgi:two-component system, OmpR family, response regulator VicR
MEKQNTKTIVYIEDDPEMIDLVSLILNRRGYTVKGANGGRQGLDMVIQEQPELVLLDLMMPDMDGWDVYQQIKANDATHDTPIIVITAKSQSIDKVLGLHIARVDDYICKPFRPAELVESIERVMSAPRPIQSSE